MDKLETYRNWIERTLIDYHRVSTNKLTSSLDSEVSDRLAFDRERDQYIWFRFGWENKRKIQQIVIYICIKNDKVWVEEDNTNLSVVDDLLAAGIPNHDLVLGFHPPKKRELTEFAQATNQALVYRA